MLGYNLILIISLIVLYFFKIDYFKGLCASIFFLILAPPNLTIEISDSFPSLTIHRIIIILWFIIWVRNKKIDKRIRNIPFAGILICISVAAGISAFQCPEFNVGIKRYFYFLTESFLFFLMLQTSLKNKKVINDLITTVIFALVFLSLLGLLEQYTGFNPTHMMGQRHRYAFERVGSTLRDQDVTSTYMHRILFGIAMASGATFCLLRINKNNHRNKNIIYWIMCFLNGSSLYFCLSRGPWIAFIVSNIFVTVIAPRLMLKKTVALAFMVLAILIIKPGIQSTFMGYYKSTADETTLKGSSYQWRYIILNIAISEISRAGLPYMLFGYGGGSHIFMNFGNVDLGTGHSAVVESWDNEYAIILFERGIVGLVLVILLYYRLLVQSLQYYKKNKIKNDVILLPLSCVLIFIFMKTNVSIYVPQLVYLEFLSIAIISALLQEKTNIEETHN